MKETEVEIQMVRCGDEFTLAITGKFSRIRFMELKIDKNDIANLISTRLFNGTAKISDSKNWFKKHEYERIKANTGKYNLYNKEEFESWKKELKEFEEDGWILDNLKDFNFHNLNHAEKTYEIVRRRWV